MNSYFIILKALFKNKLRFGENATGKKKIFMLALIGVVYALLMFLLIYFIVSLKALFNYYPDFKVVGFFVMLMTACAIVLAFGIITIVTTLYLSKDTDFYSILPVKHTTVFFAKMSFIYFTELAIVLAVLFPLTVAFGIVTNAWGWFYVISLLGMLVVPAIPLGLAALISIPVMYIASKLKNRSIVSVIFSCILFGGFIVLYFVFLLSAPNAEDIDASTVNSVSGILNSALGYVLYPLTALSYAACAVPTYGLSVANAALANIGIFSGAAVVLLLVLWLAGKFMYAQSVKANNQTDNSKAKKSSFKASGSFRALLRREYLGTLLSNQIAFQCFAPMLLPIIFPLVFGLSMSGFTSASEGVPDAAFIPPVFVQIIMYGMVAIVIAAISNGATTSFSREGSALASLKVLPVSPKRIFWSKLSAWLFIVMPVTAVSVGVASIFSFNPAVLVLALCSIVPLSGLYAAFGMLWDLMRPKINWTDPMQAIKHNGNLVIYQLITMGTGLVALFSAVAMISSVSLTTVATVFWSIIYAAVAIFAAVDFILYKKLDKFYNRIEI